MLRIFLLFIIILIIGIVQPLDMLFQRPTQENFVVPNVHVPYNWYQGSPQNTHVYSGTQPGDSHEFNSSGEYVKDVGNKDYVGCRNKGFTKEFCLQTPYTRMAPGTCMCEDGRLGRMQPGFKGNCVCANSNFGANYLS